MTGADDRRRAAAHVFVGGDELGEHGPPVLSNDVRHHLTRVLRLRDGSTISLCDGAGRWRLATTVGERDAMRVDPVGDVHSESLPAKQVMLATAMPKGDRLDWLVQKCTELGVHRVQLLHAEHSVVRWKPSDTDKKLTRLRRIAESAAQQSRRVWLPELVAPVAASAVLADMVIAEPGGRPIGDDDLRIAIGPEGGWSAAELAGAGDSVTLGPNVLRTETAAVAAIALSVAASH